MDSGRPRSITKGRAGIGKRPEFSGRLPSRLASQVSGNQFVEREGSCWSPHLICKEGDRKQSAITARNEECLAGDPAGIARRQEDGGRRDVLGVADTTERLLG